MPLHRRSNQLFSDVWDSIWVVAGSDDDQIFKDAWVFHLPSATWRRPSLKGDRNLLHRTSHATALHPLRPDVLLLCMGYGNPSGGPDYTWLNDLVTINTLTGEVAQVRVQGTVLPEPRAYHSFTAMGERCYMLGGRHKDVRLLEGRQMVAVFDAATSRWSLPVVTGLEMEPRSSHRAVALPHGVLVFGGAGDKKRRFADLRCLVVPPGGGGLSWQLLGEPPAEGGWGAARRWGTTAAAVRGLAGGSDENQDRQRLPPARRRSSVDGGATWPAPRAAHCLELVGDKLYVMAGYGPDADGHYSCDCWRLPLRLAAAPAPATRLPASPVRAAAAPPPPPPRAEALRHSGTGSEWRTVKRSGRQQQAAWAEQRAAAAAAAEDERPAAKRLRRGGEAGACAPPESPPRAAGGWASPTAEGGGYDEHMPLTDSPAPALLSEGELLRDGLGAAPTAGGAPGPGGSAAQQLAQRARELQQRLQEQERRRARELPLVPVLLLTGCAVRAGGGVQKAEMKAKLEEAVWEQARLEEVVKQGRASALAAQQAQAAAAAASAQAAEQSRGELSACRAEAGRLEVDLEKERQARRRDVERYAEEATQLGRTMEGLRTDNALLVEEKAKLQEHLLLGQRQVEGLGQQVERLQGQLSAAREEMGAERERFARATKDLEGAADGLRREVNELTARLAGAEARAAAEGAAARRAAQRAADADAAAERCRADAEHARGAAAAAQAAAAALRGAFVRMERVTPDLSKLMDHLVGIQQAVRQAGAEAAAAMLPPALGAPPGDGSGPSGRPLDATKELYEALAAGDAESALALLRGGKADACARKQVMVDWPNWPEPPSNWCFRSSFGCDTSDWHPNETAIQTVGMLFAAALGGCTEAVAPLLAAGTAPTLADVNAAIVRGSAGMLAALLRAAAPFVLRSHEWLDGSQADPLLMVLMCAYSHGLALSARMARLLLEAGYAPHVYDEKDDYWCSIYDGNDCYYNAPEQFCPAHAWGLGVAEESAWEQARGIDSGSLGESWCIPRGSSPTRRRDGSGALWQTMSGEPWSVSTHKHALPALKAAVRTVLLAARRGRSAAGQPDTPAPARRGTRRTAVRRSGQTPTPLSCLPQNVLMRVIELAAQPMSAWAV
eukprot:scaffold8.g1699.t1